MTTTKNYDDLTVGDAITIRSDSKRWIVKKVSPSFWKDSVNLLQISPENGEMDTSRLTRIEELYADLGFVVIENTQAHPA